MQYNKYNIRATDSFKAFDFPKVEQELDDLIEASKKNSSTNKGAIIVSYLKDHSLQNEWIAANPELTSLLTGGHFTTSHMEALFESSRENQAFTKGLEKYITDRLAQ